MAEGIDAGVKGKHCCGCPQSTQQHPRESRKLEMSTSIQDSTVWPWVPASKMARGLAGANTLAPA